LAQWPFKCEVVLNRRSSDSQEFTDEDIARRRDAVIRHMINTPPKPHSEMKIGKRKPKASVKASPPEKGGRPK
jgi:hypothetical protein